MSSILITGSNRGLGLEWARQYAEEGWRVYATCRHPEQADALQELHRAHPNLSIHRLDVTSADQINALRAALSGEPVDVLVNNAGVYFEKGSTDSIGQIHYDAWQATFQVNTLGPVRVTEAFVDHIARSNKRLVVAITSHMGSIADIESPGSYAYRSSKAALNATVKGLSRELQTRGIGSVLLHPGWVRTRMGGTNAPITPRDSVRGMRALVEQFRMSMSGRFFRYDGATMPW